MNYIRTLSIGDEKFLKELVCCHKRIFPDSVQNIFGDQYLMRSFYWFMLNHEKRGILVCQKGRRIIGFLTMRQSDDQDNFIKYIYRTIIWCFISKPALLLNFSLLKKMLKYLKPNKSFRTRKKHIELVTIGVLPSFVNKGIGMLLLKEFDEYAKNKKISLVKLYVLKDNKISVNFYFANGWVKKAINFGEYDLFNLAERNIPVLLLSSVKLLPIVSMRSLVMYEYILKCLFHGDSVASK